MMTTRLCTASNNGGAFMRLGKTPQERQLLFYSACVPARLVLVMILLVAAWYIPTALCWFSAVAGCVALVFGIAYAIYYQGCRWWRPSSLAIVAAAVVAVAVTYIANNDKATPFLIGALVFAHLLSGVAQSVHAQPWRTTT